MSTGHRKFVITNPERPCPCGAIYDIRIPDEYRWVSVSLACPGCGENPLWWDDAECLTDTGPEACGHLHCQACDLKWIGHES